MVHRIIHVVNIVRPAPSGSPQRATVHRTVRYTTRVTHVGVLVRAVRRDLEAVVLGHGAILYEARDRITPIYFLQRCVISLVATAGDGPGVEVGLVGNEGMAGLSVFLGAATSTTQALSQIPDGAWRMEVGAFGRAIARRASLRRILTSTPSPPSARHRNVWRVISVTRWVHDTRDGC